MGVTLVPPPVVALASLVLRLPLAGTGAGVLRLAGTGGAPQPPPAGAGLPKPEAVGTLAIGVGVPQPPVLVVGVLNPVVTMGPLPQPPVLGRGVPNPWGAAPKPLTGVPNVTGVPKPPAGPLLFTGVPAGEVVTVDHTAPAPEVVVGAGAVGAVAADVVGTGAALSLAVPHVGPVTAVRPPLLVGLVTARAALGISAIAVVLEAAGVDSAAGVAGAFPHPPLALLSGLRTLLVGVVKAAAGGPVAPREDGPPPIRDPRELGPAGLGPLEDGAEGLGPLELGSGATLAGLLPRGLGPVAVLLPLRSLLPAKLLTNIAARDASEREPDPAEVGPFGLGNGGPIIAASSAIERSDGSVRDPGVEFGPAARHPAELVRPEAPADVGPVLLDTALIRSKDSYFYGPTLLVRRYFSPGKLAPVRLLPPLPDSARPQVPS